MLCFDMQTLIHCEKLLLHDLVKSLITMKLFVVAKWKLQNRLWIQCSVTIFIVICTAEKWRKLSFFSISKLQNRMYILQVWKNGYWANIWLTLKIVLFTIDKVIESARQLAKYTHLGNIICHESWCWNHRIYDTFYKMFVPQSNSHNVRLAIWRRVTGFVVLCMYML